MNSQDKELIRAARRDPDEFEKLYKKYKNSKSDGATIASKMGYYAKLDENGDYSGSDSGGGSGDDGGSKPGFVAKGNDFLKGLLNTQKVQTTGYDDKEFTRINDVLDVLNEKGGKIGGIKDVLGRAISNIGEGIATQLEQEAQLRTTINEQVGLQGELSRGVREEMMSAYPATLRLGYGIDQLTSMMTNLMGESGRFNMISQETIQESAKIARAFVGDLSDMGKVFNEFERVGVGAKEAMQGIEKAGVSSLSLGLNSKKTTELLRTDLGKLNEFGFANGVQGLNRMVQKSLEFRMSMSEVFKIADKVFSPESALELSANLQVLGGAIGDFNDPLKLMYMATNNVEGLQDALIGAAGSLATYNQEQGRFEITGVNLRKAKAMAQELGISYDELAKGAIASAERSSAASALMMNGLVMKDDEKEFLTNLSRMKDGKMVIEVPKTLSDEFKGATEVALEDLTEAQKTTLLRNKEAFEKMSAEDIARGQLNATENIQRDVAFMAATARGQAVNAVKSAAKAAGFNDEEVADKVKKMTDNVVNGSLNGMKDINDWVSENIKKLKGTETKQKGSAAGKTEAVSVEEANKKAEAAAKASGEKVTTVRYEYNFKGGETVTDGIRRQIVKDASIKDDFIYQDADSYIVPPKN